MLKGILILDIENYFEYDSNSDVLSILFEKKKRGEENRK